MNRSKFTLRSLILTQEETNEIETIIIPIFEKVLNEYDFGKYPADDYQRFKLSFSSLKLQNPEIKDALMWKWGHWGKSNFPQHHKDLIAIIENSWPKFINSLTEHTSKNTFHWWKSELQTRSRYITVAYITHLVHYNEPFPIIDQHNFRAMNALITRVRPNHKSKKKPSDWDDIVALKSFMELLGNTFPKYSFSEIDHFLMMYGRNHAAR